MEKRQKMLPNHGFTIKKIFFAKIVNGENFDCAVLLLFGMGQNNVHIFHVFGIRFLILVLTSCTVENDFLEFAHVDLIHKHGQ